MKDVKDTRLTLETEPDLHVELFTQFPNDVVNLTYPSLKMGYFRVRRQDSSFGERYFVSDIRESSEPLNALMIHSVTDKSLLDGYNIKANYECDKLRVYRYGEHQVAHNKILTINQNGLMVTTQDC